VHSAFRGITKEKATGLAVIVGGAEEAILSPLYWILAIAFFTLLMAASRLHNKALRACFILDANTYRHGSGSRSVNTSRLCICAL
jgi:hypothetical protein